MRLLARPFHLLSFVVLSAIGPFSPHAMAESATSCAGTYAINANGYQGTLTIQEDPVGKITGTMSFPGFADTIISGSCTVNGSGIISFTRLGTSQQYSGTWTVDASGKTIMLGNFADSTGAIYPWGATAGNPNADERVIHITSTSEADALRTQLIQAIWQSPSIPTTVPQMVRTNVAPPFPLTSLLRTDQLTIDLGQGYLSYVYVFYPRTSSNQLMIFHQGHLNSLDLAGGSRTIQFFLNLGYTVMGYYMPLFGPNSLPAGTTPGNHATMFPDTTSVLPIRYFLEPVVQGVNYSLSQNPFPYIGMIGISGGGWTTHFLPAIDTRIAGSFPVAGSLPLYLRNAAGDRGDLEQFQPALYFIAGYTELYFLGSLGANRKEVQILNQYDGCCFAQGSTPDYVAVVQQALEKVANGANQFQFGIVPNQTEHEITSYALTNFVQPNLPIASVTPPTVAVLPFTDDFSRGNSASLGGSWALQTGWISLSSRKAVAQAPADASDTTLYGVSATDVTVSAAVDNGLGGGSSRCTSLSVRYTGPGDANMYMGGVCNDSNGLYSAHIWRNVGGNWALLKRTPLATATGTVQFNAQGSFLSVSFNGVPVLGLTDTVITGPGSVGLRSFSLGSTYQSLSAAGLPPPPPATLPFSDNFSRPDSASLGGSWVEQAGWIPLLSGRAVSKAPGDASDATLSGVSAVDVTLSAAVDNGTTGSNCTSLSARYTGSADSNMYIGGVCADSSGVYSAHIWRNVGGNWTLLGTTPLTTATGTVQFDARGSSLTLKFNGALVLSVTDTAIKAPGSVGLRTYGARGVYHNFSAAVLGVTGSF